MAKPRVFISSTCYDLSEVRDKLEKFIESMGYEPVRSDKGNVPYDPAIHTFDACLNEVRRCHMLVLVIAGRYGGTVDAEGKISITRNEYRAAKELGIPIFTVVKNDVIIEKRTYSNNLKTPVK